MIPILVAVAVLMGGSAYLLVVRPFGGADENSTSFAYITERELVIRNMTGIVARVPRASSAAYAFRNSGYEAENKAVWTNRGRYVAMLKNVDITQDDPKNEKLIVVDASTGDVRTLACPSCTDIAAVGENDVLATVDWATGNVHRFTLTAATPPRQETLRLAAPQSGLHMGDFIDSSPSFVLTASEGNEASGGGSCVQLYPASGSGGRFVGCHPGRVVAAGHEHDGGVTHVLAFAIDGGLCSEHTQIEILESAGDQRSPDSPKHQPTNVSAMLPEGFNGGAGGGYEILDLAWAPDGHFYATARAWTCGRGGPGTGVAETDRKQLWSPSSLYRLDGSGWTRVGTDPVFAFRQLGPSASLELVKADCVGKANGPSENFYTTCNAGTLYLTSDGRRVELERGVLLIVTPPAGLVFATHADGATASTPAAFSSESRSVPARPSATKIVELTPVDNAGRPTAGWSIVDMEDSIDCAVSVGADSALVSDIYECAGNSHDTCWIAAEGDHALCLDDPFGRQLTRVKMTAPPTGTGKWTRPPRPLGLVLGSGETCRLRMGGAAENQESHPQLVPVYYCRGVTVWADGDDVVRTSVDPWTALVGTSKGPLTEETVVTAYFVRTAS